MSRSTMLLAASIAFASLAPGCVVHEDIWLSDSRPLPFGGTFTARVRSLDGTCEPPFLLESLTLCLDTFTLERVSSSAPGVIDVEAIDAGAKEIVLRGLAVGYASVTAETSVGEARQGYSVRAPDAAEVTFQCDPLAQELTPSAPGPYTVSAGADLSFSYSLYGQGELLQGEDFPCPFGGIAPGRRCTTPGALSLAAPSAGGATLDIEFLPDPTTRLLFSTYEAAAFTQLDVAFAPEAVGIVGRALAFTALARIGTEIPCVDRLKRTATIETPDVCSFSSLASLSTKQLLGRGDRGYPDPFTLYARAPGACTVTVSVDGTSLQGSASIDVVP